MTPAPHVVRQGLGSRSSALRRGLFVPACLGLAFGLPSCGDGQGDGDARADLFTVSPTTLRISVNESGELASASETVIKSEVEGQATVIFLVPEGTIVRKGDKLVELDASELIDRKANQQIALEKAQAALVEAEQNLEIQKKEIIASEETAKSVLTIALMDQEKFLGKLRSRPKSHGASVTAPANGNGHTNDGGKQDDASATDGHEEPAPSEAQDGGGQGAASGQVKLLPHELGTNREMVAKLEMLVKDTPLASLGEKARSLLGATENLDRDMGEMAQNVLEQIDKVRLAEADLKLKENTLRYSEQLYAKSYIAKQDRDKHRLDWERGVSQVTLAKNELDLLINYTLRTTQIELQQAVDNARLELERVIASNIARRAREKADFASKQAEFNLAKERFENLVEQIGKAIIFAPGPGLVVYAQQGDGRRGREVVEEGGTVYQRQKLITLPDVERMICNLKVKEADIDKVAPGQVAAIKLDAYPDRTFTGRVSQVSPLPDAGSRWSNNDRKVYKTQVSLDPCEASLRPGMAAGVEIVITEIENALAVPMTAVRRQGSVHFVWKSTPSGPIATRVDVGQNNLTHVQLLEGVTNGDSIYLAPPEGVETPEFEQPAERIDSKKPSTDGAGPDAATTDVASEKKGDAATSSSRQPDAPGPGRQGEGRQGEGRQRGGSDGGRRSGPSGRRSIRPMSPAMRELVAMLAKRLPKRADEIKAQGMRLMRDPEVAEVLESDPEIKAKWEEIRASFRGRAGTQGRGPGGRDRGGNRAPGGNRVPGEQNPQNRDG